MSKRAREAARARIAAQREALRRQERRRRITMIVTVAVVAVVAISVGWWSVLQGKAENNTALAPVTVQQDGSVVMAQPGVTSPVVDVYEDFQCPACRQFEETSGSTLKNLAAEGKAKVVYHVLTIFSQEPTKSNSLRAAAAARCVPDGKQWMAFHDRLYAEQPSETRPGFQVDDLVDWGKDAGVTSPDFESCVRDQRHVKAHQEYASKAMSENNLQGTPTVKVDGKEIDNTSVYVPSALREAVLAAGGK